MFGLLIDCPAARIYSLNRPRTCNFDAAYDCMKQIWFLVCVNIKQWTNNKMVFYVFMSGRVEGEG